MSPADRLSNLQWIITGHSVGKQNTKVIKTGRVGGRALRCVFAHAYARTFKHGAQHLAGWFSRRNSAEPPIRFISE